MPPQTATRRAYAKVNLALAVGPPIPAGLPNAGFHPIASWMHAINLFDEVGARPLGSGEPSRFRVEWAGDAPRRTPIDWPIEKDLAFRAHAALERGAGRSLPVEIVVKKRIPVGGGLGGGSSDAAAALMLLDEVFELGLGAARLAEIGLGVGSDVPFFVDTPPPPRPAFAGGLGERIERVARIEGDLVLLVPPYGCATGAVYRSFDASPAALRENEVRRMAGTGRLDGGALFNDLLPAAERVEPRLADVRRRAERVAGAPVHTSGSGSTLFVLAGGESGALAAKIGRELPDVVVVRTRLA